MRTARTVQRLRENAEQAGRRAERRYAPPVHTGACCSLSCSHTHMLFTHACAIHTHAHIHTCCSHPVHTHVLFTLLFTCRYCSHTHMLFTLLFTHTHAVHTPVHTHTCCSHSCLHTRVLFTLMFTRTRCSHSCSHTHVLFTLRPGDGFLNSFRRVCQWVCERSQICQCHFLRVIWSLGKNCELSQTLRKASRNPVPNAELTSDFGCAVVVM